METSDIYTDMVDNYFGSIRYDLLSMIPSGTQRLLDVGCGEGLTGMTAKEQSGVREVVGLELIAAAADKAAERLDRVLTGSLEQMSQDTFPPGYFDCIMCGDVLEHLVDPWKALMTLSTWLNDDGVIIASIPNIRNLMPLLRIVFDRFEYQDYGVLDRTHLRFFTLHTIKGMFESCGFEIITIETNRGRNWKFRLLTILSLGILSPFAIFQYRIVARKRR